MLKSSKLAVVSLFMLATGCSSVSGVVKDSETSTPISSATVTVVRSSTSTTTDAVGHYNLMGAFLPGDTLMVNAPGYNIFTGSLQSSGNQIVDIELVPKK